MLRLGNTPTLEREINTEIKLTTGTLWHKKWEQVWRGKAAMFEVNVTDWLPEGWAGTADWLIWNPDTKKFRLRDLKTTASTYFIHKEGVKDEHLYQGSAYYHALRAGNLPMESYFDIYYMPISGKYPPLLLECKPVSKSVLRKIMEDRWVKCQDYLNGGPLAVPDYKHWVRKFCPYSDKFCDCNKGE